MKKTFSKLMALVLTLCLLSTLVSVNVFAAVSAKPPYDVSIVLTAPQINLGTTTFTAKIKIVKGATSTAEDMSDVTQIRAYAGGIIYDSTKLSIASSKISVFDSSVLNILAVSTTKAIAGDSINKIAYFNSVPKYLDAPGDLPTDGIVATFIFTVKTPANADVFTLSLDPATIIKVGTASDIVNDLTATSTLSAPVQQKIGTIVTKYGVTVTNGTPTPATAGSGDTVSITANAAPLGQRFKNWTSSDVTVLDPNSATTTFTMPANAVAITANYEDIPAATLTSIAITTPATKLAYTVGDLLDITGLVVKGTYSDQSVKTETVTASDVTGFDSTLATASQTLTITVGGKTTSYDISIVNKEQSAPTDLTGVAPTSVANNDGQITGATTAMEYKKSDEANYKPVTATPITGLAAGTYNVRYAAKAGYNVGASADVIVAPYILATDANLSALSVTGATLNETFDANTLLYTATVANDVTSVTINATKSDSKATVAGDGAQSLSIVGVNTFNVVVTAENTSVKTYVVKITRQTPPVDGAVVKVGDDSGYIEQTVTVPVTITKMTGLDNFDVKISYETSALTYFSGIKGPSITGATEITHSLTGTTGEIIISGLAVGNGSIGLEGDIVVANITFTVKKGIAAGSSIVKVLAGIYNTATVSDTNFTNGTITYTLATDEKLLDAIQAVESFETTVATTIADITTLLGTEQSVRDTVNLVTLPESQTAKLALLDKIDARSTALKAERTALQAEEAAADLVLAYEDAPLTTLDEVATAEGKKSPAFNAVDALRESPTKVNLLSRIGGQDTIVANARIALTKIAKLVLINAGTATLADYQVIAPSATEALLDNYKRGVVALGKALTEAQVIALVLQVNTPAEPVINVKIIGQAVTGSVLTATYEYYDANYDLDPGLGKTWTVTDGNPVKEETYTVALGDVGKTITVSVWNVSSAVSLPVIRRGDITMDGKILSRDAFFLREIFNETFTKTDTDLIPSPEKIEQYKAVADYDNNGFVNALDLADVLINSEI